MISVLAFYWQEAFASFILFMSFRPPAASVAPRSAPTARTSAVVPLAHAALCFLVTFSSLLRGSLYLTDAAAVSLFVTTLPSTPGAPALHSSSRSNAPFRSVLSVLKASVDFTLPSPSSPFEDAEGITPLSVHSMSPAYADAVNRPTKQESLQRLTVLGRAGVTDEGSLLSKRLSKKFSSTVR